MGCSLLQNGCQLHSHAADSVLTSWCSFISQQIWNIIFIVLAILGICIMIETLSIGKRSMCIHISGFNTISWGTMSSRIFTTWCRWHSGRRWRWFWHQLSEMDWWSCTRSFEPPQCLTILCWAIVPIKAAVRLIIISHSWLSFYRTIHISMPRKLNSPLSCSLYFSARFVDQVLHFFYCGVHEPSFGHFCHIAGKAHVRLF